MLPQPPWVFSIRGLRLFISPSWSPGLCGLLRSSIVLPGLSARMWSRRVLTTALPAPFSATLSPALSVYLCVNVGLQGLPVVRLPAPFIPHSSSLGPTTATRVLSTPVPISAPPTGLYECLFSISLVSDPLAVRFSVSSGCARMAQSMPPSWFSLHRVFIFFYY